jgi:hypothetical protein
MNGLEVSRLVEEDVEWLEGEFNSSWPWPRPFIEDDFVAVDRDSGVGALVRVDPDHDGMAKCFSLGGVPDRR